MEYYESTPELTLTSSCEASVKKIMRKKVNSIPMLSKISESTLLKRRKLSSEAITYESLSKDNSNF